ncbi:HAD-IA family hydrolase [Vreelandella aquamarina]|uniref:HAD-IA family hydrolase n=1 Tax=Vreelandella aquamarina TaxID=77097 RepID=UPI001D18EBC6|nr:HAD-IA family hydrolase [Halomonas meridiana]MCC4288863.1 HAD-IA family hydrolase [Halomonas meridiana]
MKPKKLKALLENTSFFDKIFYLRQYQDARLSDASSIDHYITIGIKENRKPNQLFDPEWYLSNYPDVKEAGINPVIHFLLNGRDEGRLQNAEEKKQYDDVLNRGEFDAEFYKNQYADLQALDEKFDLLTHYIRHGQHEGRAIKAQQAAPEIAPEGPAEDPQPPAVAAVEPVAYESEYESEDEALIAASGLFDTNYYLGSYPDIAASGQEPIKHFCNHGWKEDRNPNEDFNTRYYQEKYPDVAAANMNPFLHWLKYGQHEGRLINRIEISPNQEQPAASPSIIFVSHEASQTGAPAVLLSLMQWIKDNTDINFSIVVGASGPWNYKFKEMAPTFFMDAYHHHEVDKELRIFCGSHVKAVYVNTIASALYAERLEFLQAEFITHVHEMENVFQVFQPHADVLKRICAKYIAVSQGSIDAIQKRFDLSQIELKFLKPFIDKKRLSAGVANKPTPKKVIFGCGAVEMRKGFDLFCITAAILKAKGRDDFQFYWIGSDTNKDLKAFDVIQQHGVADVVEFLGVKDYPRDYFEWGDVFLLPSREDPYPLVCMEAAECDMPVICFDDQAGGMHSFVENDAGAVVPYLNTEAMADAVADLLDNEPKRKACGMAAHQKVIDRHYVDVIAPQILDFLPQSVHISDSNELQSYKRHIEQASAVSFDIFDTLVTRKLHDPNVVFDVIEYRHTQSEAAPLPLFHERMQTAGKVLGSYKGEKDDISIDEIYANMAFYQNSEIEKQTEIQMCVAHPMGKALYDYAKSLGKRIIITSDMYLDKETVQSILTQNGYEGWDVFYLSSEQGEKKDTGKLFERLKNEAQQHGIAPHDILHLGDNWIGDVKCAREAGLQALRFSPIYDKAHKLFTLSAEQENQLSQIGRIWNSFSTQATRLWRETQPEAAQDFYTRLGFELTGPLAAMMAMHTKTLADDIGAKKVVFMARDGRIIKKAFERLYQQEIKQGHYNAEYLHLSRSTVIPATFEHPLSSNDLYFLIEGLHLQQKPVSYFIQKANLDSEDQTVQAVSKRYFDSLEAIPAMEDLNKLTQMFNALSSEIYSANAPGREALARYLAHYQLLDQEAVLFVDVGWMLNIQSRLDRFMKEQGAASKVVGSYVGSRDRINKSIAHASLLFDSGDPFMYANFLEQHVTLFEVLFSSPEPSAAKLVLEDGKVVTHYKPLQKPIPDQEFQVAQKLHCGAEAFFAYLAQARQEFFPEQISKDYFFKLFEALVNTDSDVAKATLGNFEVQLGGHHEFSSTQQLVKTSGHFEYALKQHDEYFEPIHFTVEPSRAHATLVTSAGLDNGSTRYRAIHLADALRHQGISSTLIHAATPVEKAHSLIQTSSSLILQRCFEDQGNVGEFLTYAKEQGITCIAEMDDLVFPEHIPSVGSVKGGEWKLEEAMFVATAYEKLIKQADACIVSTPPLKAYIEQSYHLPTRVVRNKVTPKRLKAPAPIDPSNIKLIYASGTYSHKEDFDIIEAVLYEFLVAHPQVSLSVLGAAQVSERILALSNVSNYPYMRYTAMLDFIAKHDLMLVPLVDDEFNRAKSSVKFVECSAVGVPVLASKVGEFEYAIEHEHNGLLAETAEAFGRLLEQVTTKPEIIERMAKNASDTIHEYYTTTYLEEGVVEMVVGN